MRVILIKDVGGVGRHGEVKNVADGYGFNFLIARGLAVQATPEKVAAHEAATKREEEAREKERAALKSIVESLEGQRIEMKVRATEKGGLFKSITAADIKKALEKNIPEDAIQLAKPIKEVGEHTVALSAAGAKANVTIVVVGA